MRSSSIKKVHKRSSVFILLLVCAGVFVGNCGYEKKKKQRKITEGKITLRLFSKLLITFPAVTYFYKFLAI